jgi:hypothetical protein
MDEFRIYKSARSDAWFKFEFKNMTESDQELTWGAAEDPPVATSTGNFFAIGTFTLVGFSQPQSNKSIPRRNGVDLI